MINFNKIFLIIILTALFNIGCISTSGGSIERPRIKDTAATLDAIPIGTSFEAIRDNYFETVQFYEQLKSLDAYYVAIYIESLCDALVYNTYEKNFEDIYNFFRMHPIDLFLKLEEGDLYGRLSVAEINYNRADIYIFFTKDKKYKGYYGYGWCGGNTKEELRFMKTRLLQAGYGKLCDYGKGKWEGWQELNSSLQLPLIQHIDK